MTTRRCNGIGSPGSAEASDNLTAGPPTLAIQDLTVGFGGRRVLGPVTLTFPLRQMSVLIGAAGSGKSVLLRAFNRLVTLQPGAEITGRILLGGLDIFDPGLMSAELRRRIGMVFAVPTPLPMSVRANIAFAMRLHGRPGRATLTGAIEESLRRVGLWPAMRERMNRHAATLGCGEQQLLCIARALAIGAEILLLDDPTQTLDPAEVARLEAVLGELKSQMTIIMATSQLPFAARSADLIVLLQDGLVVEADSPARLLTGARDPRAIAYLAGRIG